MKCDVCGDDTIAYAARWSIEERPLNSRGLSCPDHLSRRCAELIAMGTPTSVLILSRVS